MFYLTSLHHIINAPAFTIYDNTPESINVKATTDTIY